MAKGSREDKKKNKGFKYQEEWKEQRRKELKKRKAIFGICTFIYSCVIQGSYQRTRLGVGMINATKQPY